MPTTLSHYDGDYRFLMQVRHPVELKGTVISDDSGYWTFTLAKPVNVLPDDRIEVGVLEHGVVMRITRERRGLLNRLLGPRVTEYRLYPTGGEA